VASYLPAQPHGYLVAAAGPGARDAAAALRGSLRQAPAARVVMDDAALGSLEGLDDAAIVARARPLPVEAIVVVRVFPGGDGQPPRAVVTFYDKKGAAKVAFTTIAGMPIEAKPAAAPAAVGEGLGEAAADEISAVLRQHSTGGARAKEDYDARSLDLAGTYTIENGNVTSTSGLPYQGRKNPRLLTWDEFYRLLGRPDLEKRYRERHGARQFLIGAGVVLTVGGFVLALIAAANADSGCSGGGSCDATGVIGWGAVGSIGVIAMFGGYAMSENPVPLSEMRAATDAYNEKLRRDLGLNEAPPAPAPPAHARARRPRWFAAPRVAPSAGGLTLGLQY
jgi:hypothetical protein